MAQILADHLTSVLGWTQGSRDVMNGFGMDGDVANGSFEETAPFGGYGWRYLNDYGVSRVYSPAGALDGEYYLRLSNGAASHQPIPASDGETFTVAVWLRGANDGDQVDITMDFRDQEMWTTPLQTATETKTLTTDWQQYAMTATAPTGTPNPVFHHRVTFTAAATDTVDIDDVAMQPPGCFPRGNGNGDCYIDMQDFLSLAACFAGPDVPVGTDCACYDFDDDESVDLSDFAGFQLVFTGPTEPIPDCPE
jgi:hypothetical protein